MSKDQEIDVTERLKDRPRIRKALHDAVQKAFRFHKLMGHPLIVWRDGKVVEIPPEEIVLDDEPHTNGNGSIKSP
jgi:hypothetical protein